MNTAGNQSRIKDTRTMAKRCVVSNYLQSMDVMVLTDKRYLGPSSGQGEPMEGYIDNLLTEDRLVMDALVACGLTVDRRAWCDNSVNWSQTKSALFRTTWDYFDRWDSFSPWLHRVQDQTRLFNAAPIVHWNLDKHYLQDLEQRGVKVVPTAFIQRQTLLPLFDLMARSGWSDVVIKPAIAGAAVDTYRVTRSGEIATLSPKPTSKEDCESLWHALLAKQDMLVQPFLSHVIETGEKSLIWIDGEVTHGVLKRAKSGDFRVQDDHGGTVAPLSVTQTDKDLAQDIMTKCLQHCASQGWEAPLYARVDLMRNEEGQWLVSELEMVEPELWFRFHPEAAQTLAQAIKARLTASA